MAGDHGGRTAPSPSRSDKPPAEPPPNGDTPPLDGRLYYGYLFQTGKIPTDLFDALLRAIADHIARNIGDTSVSALVPDKLAAFYHAVGGDYDQLFKAIPNKSISYIWQALGVQHSLQPDPTSDFNPPCVPALTPKGFVRWESIQILLGPEEHVPFMQYAVRNWKLKHPDTGEPFPPDLPAEAFPAQCDPDIDRWHKQCAERLDPEYLARMAPEEPRQPPPPPPRDPRVYAAYSHVPNSGPESRARRGSADIHHSERGRPPYHHSSSFRHSGQKHPSTHLPSGTARLHVVSPGSSPRRTSLDEKSPRRPGSRSPPRHLDPNSQYIPRRHSHPKHYTSDDSGSERPRYTGPAKPRIYDPPPSSIRRVPVSTMQTASPRARRDVRSADDPRRKSLESTGIRQKLYALTGLRSSTDRHRSSSREPVVVEAPVSARYERKPPGPRLSRSFSEDEDSQSEESGSEVSPKPRSSANRIDSEREFAMRRRAAFMEKERQDKEYMERRELEKDKRNRKEPPTYLRPAPDRRSSSHADADRRARAAEYGWDLRDGRSRERYDNDRDRDRPGSREWDSREIRHHTDDDGRRRKDYVGRSATVRGVSGRRYPSEKAWT